MNTTSSNIPYQSPISVEASSDAPALPKIQSVGGDGELGTLVLTDESEPLNVAFGGVALNAGGEHDFQQAAEQAVRLRVAHLCRLGQRALAEAIELGGLLFEIKERLGHGNWLPFLRTVEINERTARNYLLFHKLDLLKEKRRRPARFLVEAHGIG